MADYESPRPFRRERNLSNRNFAKRNSNRRRLSTDSHSSVDSKIPATNNDDELNNNSDKDDTFDTTMNATTNALSYPSTPLAPMRNYSQLSVSLDAEKTSAKTFKSILKVRSLDQPSNSPIVDDDERSSEEPETVTPDSPDPAMWRFSQKRNIFENLQSDENTQFKAAKFKSKSTQSLLTSERRFATRQSDSPSPTSSSSASGSYLVSGPRVASMGNELSLLPNRHSSFHASIDEERSEDEVDGITTEEMDNVEQSQKFKDAEDFAEVRDSFGDETEGEEFEPPTMAVNESFLSPVFKHSMSQGAEKRHIKKEKSEENAKNEEQKEQQEQQENKDKDVQMKPKSKDFPR